MSEKIFHLHLVSDSTGETINNIARAGLAQFENIKTEQHVWSLIRSSRQLYTVIESVKQKPGLILYTFVDEELRSQLETAFKNTTVVLVPVLDPVLKSMASYFGIPSSHAPGRQHALNADYFARIDAMDYALARDDGQGVDRLEDADVIILGVSRTSKTPTCLYLANRGIKAANIPIVPHQAVPKELSDLKKPLIVGLTKDPESLVEIRRNRLQFLHEKRETSYADPEKVYEEVRDARKIFTKLGCSVIDVSHRSIEETAAEILTLLSRRAMANVDQH